MKNLNILVDLIFFCRKFSSFLKHANTTIIIIFKNLPDFVMKSLLLVFILSISVHSMIIPIPQAIDNCKIQNQIFQCQECEEEYVLDEEENECINENSVNSTNSTNSTNATYGEITEQILISAGFKSSDLNCKIANANGLCVECYPTYYFSLTRRKCIPVSPLCETWNSLGHCLTCYKGFEIVSIFCVVSKNLERSIVQDYERARDPHCRKYRGNICVQCAFRFYFDDDGICTSVHPDCNTWDSTGKCTTCYDGYEVVGRYCALNVVTAAVVRTAVRSSDQNCQTANKDGVCEKCQWRHYFDKNNICQKVSDLCNEWDEDNGDCTSCYKGYDQRKGKCIEQDPFCSINSDEGCVQCIDRYYVHDDGRCKLVDLLCEDYYPLSGQCIKCREGFTPEKRKCV